MNLQMTSLAPIFCTQCTVTETTPIRSNTGRLVVWVTACYYDLAKTVCPTLTIFVKLSSSKIINNR